MTSTRNGTPLYETTDGIPRNEDHRLRWCEQHQTRDNCHEWNERHEELHAKYMKSSLRAKWDGRSVLGVCIFCEWLQKLGLTKPWDWS